ncbi:hypothetical protein ACIA8G_11625 [Lentzea sp. NPDC051213]
MPDRQDAPGPTPPPPPPNPVVMSTPIHDQIATRLGIRHKRRRAD